MSYEFVFTVFTPTYNRAYTLHRVYESLISQTFRDFEWLIVDDGSTDNTRELVDQWKKEASFPIRYYWQENSGKDVAFNDGVQKAHGELFCPLDSDDACVPNALECIKWHWDSIPKEKKNEFYSVTCLCVDQYGKIVGDKYPEDVFDSDALEIRYKYMIGGEKWGALRTDVLKEYPFPTIEGFKGSLMPGMAWSTISRKYKIRFINQALRIYYLNEALREDQLSRSISPKNNAPRLIIWFQFMLNNEIDWFRYAPKMFIRSAVNYARLSFHNKKGVFT
ncbi:MAG: glycosyltransferase family 2 protein [Desulfobacterales bacterium]